MKTIGYVLIAISFLLCSYISILHNFEINWSYFIPALLIGAVGVALARFGHKRGTQSKEIVSSNLQDLNTSLGNIVTNIRDLDEQKENINVYDLHQKIDDTFMDDLNTFVDARESIGHAYTLQDYANVMSHFAAGERYLNRVWSTSVDGYIDEAHEYIQRADRQFTEAFEKLKALGND